MSAFFNPDARVRRMNRFWFVSLEGNFLMMNSDGVSPLVTYIQGRKFRMLIGAGPCDAADGATSWTYDPSTGRPIAEVPRASQADVARAVAAARAAQPAWEKLGVRGRREFFLQLARLVAQHEVELAMLDAINAGNPFGEMRADIRISIEALQDWPGLALSLNGETINASDPENLHYTLLKPYGVVGRIVPFNHPCMFAITRILPALVTGNTVVLKPGEQTPLSALAFGEIAGEVLPPGVLNIVTGAADVGDALVTHRGIKRLAFTGSVATAQRIQQRAAQFGIKHLSLELGGKNAMIVFPDCDVSRAVTGAIRGMNFTVCQGQSCGSNSRVFVHESLYRQFVEQIAAQLEGIRVGVAYEPGTGMGPLVSSSQRDRVVHYIRAGVEEGARLVTGGDTPPAGLPEGYFVRPTLFAEVTMGMRIAREEIFGPVISVFRWNDYESLIEQVNEVEFGLTASVWTNDLSLAHRTAARVDAGYVWINDSSRHYWGTPFGGTKNSGLGREESIDELRSYYELKAVHTILH